MDLQCSTRSVIASFLLAMAATTPTLAQESTLAKIKASGSVTMGVRDSSVPQSVSYTHLTLPTILRV